MLRLGLDYSEIETIHVIPYDLVNLEVGPSEIYDGIDRSKWKDGPVANSTV